MSNQQNDAFRENLEEVLQELPDKVAQALENWETATLNREKVDALLFAMIKGRDEKKSATEIKMEIQGHPEHYEVVLYEIKQHAQYTKLYEQLLAGKRRASLRTAF
jgi:hypothetical protein